MKRTLILGLLFVASVTMLHAQRTDLSGLKFCIDPGHGGHNAANDRHVIPDPGIDFWESESNFDKAVLLKPILEAKGAWVILTRNTNDYPNDADEPSLTARWTLANANNVDWFHSIHSNATGGTNTSTNYTLVLLKENISTRQAAFPEALTMSDCIYRHIRVKNRTSAYGVRLDYTFYGGSNGGFNLGVLNGLAMPGELSEGSFHDYYPETRRLMNSAYHKNEAYGILDGFLEYYHAPYDTLAIVAGIQTNAALSKPMNGSVVRLMPENRIFDGDNYNNGFFFFDSINSGPHTLQFETPGYTVVTASLTLASGSTTFYDFTYDTLPPVVQLTQPLAGDTSFVVTGTVGIRFSKPMDTSSVRTAFSILPSVAGTMTFATGNTVVFFKPSSDLAYSTWYTVRIEGTAKSAAGRSLDGNKDSTAGDAFILNFRTKAVPQGVAEISNELPVSYALEQNYPNPFNPTTQITFSIPRQEHVLLKIHDLLGREVATVVNKELNQGSYRLTFDARNLPSGIYLYTISTPSFVSTKRMIVLK